MIRKMALAGLLLLTVHAGINAQRDWRKLPLDSMLSSDTTTKYGYTLIFLNRDTALDPQVKQRLTDVFFTVYPKEAAMYNSNTAQQVIFYVDPGYKGVAATSAGLVRFNPEWFHKHPKDVDVVTHEVMHIVQAYGRGPGWLTEGIADYVRLILGVDNAGANWKLPDYKPDQSYTNAYRVTARFLYWLETKKHPGIVKELDASLRDKSYTPGRWKELTGKTLDELWAEYGQDPSI